VLLFAGFFPKLRAIDFGGYEQETKYGKNRGIGAISERERYA
jgi:hypothetical protein